MSNILGGRKTLSATFSSLSTDYSGGASRFTLRNANNNSICEFSNDGVVTIGFLNAGEAKTFYNARPADLYVKGTAGDSVYWDGDM